MCKVVVGGMGWDGRYLHFHRLFLYHVFSEEIQKQLQEQRSSKRINIFPFADQQFNFSGRGVHIRFIKFINSYRGSMSRGVATTGGRLVVSF